MKDAQQLVGLVIDVRLNGGGSDPYGVQVACRLTDKRYGAFVKRARNDPDDPDRWTAPQPTTVRASDRPRFLKRVVELVGPDTVSAGARRAYSGNAQTLPSAPRTNTSRCPLELSPTAGI